MRFHPALPIVSRLTTCTLLTSLALVAGMPGRALADAVSATSKWLVSVDTQWQPLYRRDVAEPFERGVSDLKKQYQAAIDRQMAAASQAGKLEEAVAFRAEKELLAGGGDVPAEDEALTVDALKQARAAYRKSFAKLDEDRFARAKALHGRYDALLAQNQTALTQRQRLDEALEIKTRRDELAAAWLKAPAGAALAAVPEPAATAPKLPLGQATTAVPGPKLSKRGIVEKLLALGAVVRTPGAEVKSVAELAGDKFVIHSVEFNRRPDGREWTEEELSIIEQLGEVRELQLAQIAATDATVQKLRHCRSLQALRLRSLDKVTGQTFEVINTLPELKFLLLQALPKLSDDGFKRLGVLHKLNSFELYDSIVTDACFSVFATWPDLEFLLVQGAPNLTPAGWRALPTARKLKSLSVSSVAFNAEAVGALAKCSDLEVLFVSVAVADAELAPLSALTKLRTLGLVGATQVNGACFANWPVRTSLTSLTLNDTIPLNENAPRAIAASFPRLTYLNFCAPKSGLATADAAQIGRLRQLRSLTILGGGVDDAALAELTKAANLEAVALSKSSLSETGIAALTKLNALKELGLDAPPSTDAALKSFAKIRALKLLRIAPDAPQDLEKKLKAALPNVAIAR